MLIINNAPYSSTLTNLICCMLVPTLPLDFLLILKITITQGKIHKYLGMTIYYSFPVKVIFYMIDYDRNMINDIQKDMKGGSATIVTRHIFDISEDVIKLS